MGRWCVFITLLLACKAQSTTGGPEPDSSGGSNAMCTGATADCGGTCVALETDEANCGRCGEMCPTGQLCSAGCRLPTDCFEAFHAGISIGDGVYQIDPTGGAADDAFPIYCDMSTDGGGWTLVAKTNGTDSNHYGTGPVNLAALTSIALTASGYIGDANRLAIGNMYRVTCWGATRFAHVTSTTSFSTWWGNPQMGIAWNAVFSPTAADYTEMSSDDCGINGPGPCIGLAYQGRNWAITSATGCRILGTTGYGGQGTIFVK